MSAEVAHAFADKSIKAPTFCQVCAGFILGLGKKASICSQCYFTCHKKCAADAPATCVAPATDAELVPEAQPDWLDIEKNSDLSTYYRTGDPYDSYTQKAELGRGGGGVVYEVEHKKDKTVWALKELAKDTYDLYLLEREILIMKDLNHPGLIGMKEAYMGDKVIYLVLEIVRGGELFDRIIENEYFNEKNASFVAKQMFEALAYMHKLGCAHRDIKAENVLLVSADKDDYHIKVADFGLSNALGEASKFQSCVGTTDYMAPEMLEGIRYSFGVDIWSTGVLTYIMLCGYPPFYGKTENERVEKILSGKFDFDDEVWDMVSAAAKNFIAHLLVQQPQARYTASQALEHPWITGASLEKMEDRALPTTSNLQKHKATNQGDATAPAAAAPAAPEERKKKKKKTRSHKTDDAAADGAAKKEKSKSKSKSSSSKSKKKE